MAELEPELQGTEPGPDATPALPSALGMSFALLITMAAVYAVPGLSPAHVVLAR